MNNFYRVIDANINRAAEGLRAVEEYARFVAGDSGLVARAKVLRHEVRKGVLTLSTDLLAARDSGRDPGVEIAEILNVDNKANAAELVAANFKRIEEAVRMVEEYLRPAGHGDLARRYEKLRFECYALERDYSMLFARGLPDTDFYCITDSAHSLGRSNVEVVTQMLKAGIRIIQYREKDNGMTAKEMYRECCEIRRLTADSGCFLIIDDYADLAFAVGADGVHIGQDDMPIEAVRSVVGDKMIIGLSTHSPEQMADAIEQHADYVGVGPIYRTFTKKNVCDPVGLDYLDYAAGNATVPFVAIGGIKEHNLAEVVSRGAKMICLVTEISSAENIPAKIEVLRSVVNKARKK